MEILFEILLGKLSGEGDCSSVLHDVVASAISYCAEDCPVVAYGLCPDLLASQSAWVVLVFVIALLHGDVAPGKPVHFAEEGCINMNFLNMK